jgi:ATP-dependent helicase HepA
VPKFAIGQKWTSKNEPELGIGQIIKSDFRTITLLFPVSGEQRIYNSKGEPPLIRYSLKIGEKASSVKGVSFFVEEIFEEDGILHYKNKGKSISEASLNFRRQEDESSPEILQKLRDRGFSSNFEFCQRELAAKLQAEWKSSRTRGLLGPRVELLPHQLYLSYRAVNNASLPRLMLSDEVGLGKTIESGLIWNALHSEGRIKKTMIVVPEQLKNQWIIELGKRFNHWFVNIDEAFMVEYKSRGNVSENPFLFHDLVLCSFEFLLTSRYDAQKANGVSWDLLIVDEAHRLVKTSAGENAHYSLISQLAEKTPGLLLLSGTPIQLAPEAYFYRLRLLDSARFQKWEDFEKNQKNYKRVAKDLSKIPLDSDAEISWEDLQKSIPKTSPIRSWLPIKADMSLTATEWMRRVIDALGTGSSVFRNTRKSVKGFPKRTLKVYPLANNDSLPSWLCSFVREHKSDKVLLICSKSQAAGELLKIVNENFGEGTAVAFKEEESSLERDRAAAAWMQKNGPSILLSSEIGSEGRNFQSAQHLVLWDLPEDSSLLEQRIGRLDRIGQGSEIYIHVPFLEKSKTEMLFLWYHEALGIFEHSLMGGGEMYAKFERELKGYLEDPAKKFSKFKKEFLPRGKAEMQLLNEKAEEGRDRLLEFNSQNKKLSEELFAEAKKMDANMELFDFAFKMLECLDIDVQNAIYPNSYVLKGLPEQPEHATLLGAQSFRHSENGEESESDGCSLTVAWDRVHALNYENIEFFHWEHPIMRRLFDKALGENFGVLASVYCRSVPEGQFWAQYNFILDFTVDSRWGINHLIGGHFLTVFADGSGNLHVSCEKPDDSARNFKGDIPDSVLEYFAGEGFEKAKNSLEVAVNEIAEKTEKLAISTLESELHRLEESYMLLRDFELGKVVDKKKKAILSCKKSLESPKLRLDGLRILAG